MYAIVRGRYLQLTRRLIRAFVTLLVTCVVANGAVFGGTTYGWCVPMQRPMPHCCMERMRAQTRSAEPTVQALTFELRTRDGVPTTTVEQVADPVAAAPPVVEVGVALPALSSLQRLDVRSPLGSGAIRAHRFSPVAVGPPPLSARLAQLRVYRC